MANKIQYLGTGRRKTSVARVRLVPGVTGIEINGKEMREYFTEADINKLRSVGYEEAFHDLEKGTEDYINNYLEKEFLIY